MERPGALIAGSGGKADRETAEQDAMIVNGKVFARRSLPGR
jgi:hypothetical protein